MTTREMTASELDYMRETCAVAKQSNDKSTQNGAIIVCPWDGDIVTEGFNHIPEKLQKPERFERPLKYDYTIHAERDALYKATNDGNIVEGWDMYCCWAACKDCATAISHIGIGRLFRHVHDGHLSRGDWRQSIEVGDSIMREMGVEIIDLTGQIGAEILFNGELVKV